MPTKPLFERWESCDWHYSSTLLFAGEILKMIRLLRNWKIKRALNKPYKPSTHISIRVTPEIKEWMQKKNYSTTKIWEEAIKEIKEQEEQK